jgi:hypothetical protein
LAPLYAPSDDDRKSLSAHGLSATAMRIVAVPQQLEDAMSIPRLRTAIVMAAIVVGTLGASAQSQVRRVQSPPPPNPPGFQAPSIDPVMQRLNALQADLNALRQSTGRQIVVLHFTPHPTTSWTDADNSYPKNNARAEAMCKDALGDRFGRVVSRKAEPDMSANRWFFPNVVCETQP